MNGFAAEHLTPEKASQICQGLIAESEQRFGYKSETCPHASIPALDRFFYIFSEGTKKSTINKQDATWSGTADPAKMKAATVSGSSSSTDVAIKLENPDYSKAQQFGNVLKAAKTTLEKFHTEALDLTEDLQVKVRKEKNTALEPKIVELKQATTAMGVFLQELRQQLSTVSALTMGDDCKGLSPRLEEMVQEATAHQDGWKLMRKRLKALLL